MAEVAEGPSPVFTPRTRGSQQAKRGLGFRVPKAGATIGAIQWIYRDNGKKMEATI